MRGFRLTVRHGPKVVKETYPDLDAALAAMEEWVGRLRPQARRGEADLMTRKIAPASQVAARLTVTAPGRGLMRPEAGMDIRGDGSLAPFRGAIRRHEIVPRRGETVYAALGRELGAA